MTPRRATALLAAGIAAPAALALAAAASAPALADGHAGGGPAKAAQSRAFHIAPHTPNGSGSGERDLGPALPRAATTPAACGAGKGTATGSDGTGGITASGPSGVPGALLGVGGAGVMAVAGALVRPRGGGRDGGRAA
ncbi:hypothetical protein ACF1G0_26960 [Streptomyces sp. NPDC013953]|uniref:hypothetical protein n=1 Tax=Streptomyces sp. NPDC013953 TaxID=3364868 RepID=UPI0036F59399